MHGGQIIWSKMWWPVKDGVPSGLHDIPNRYGHRRREKFPDSPRVIGRFLCDRFHAYEQLAAFAFSNASITAPARQWFSGSYRATAEGGFSNRDLERGDHQFIQKSESVDRRESGHLSEINVSRLGIREQLLIFSRGNALM